MLPQQPSERPYVYSYDCPNCASGGDKKDCGHDTTDDDGGMQGEVDLLRRQLKEAEFFYNEKKEIIEAMEREYEELEFECSEFKGIAHKYEREIERLKSYFGKIKSLLVPVLCDPEGYVCIHGSDADKEEIQKALAILERESK